MEDQIYQNYLNGHYKFQGEIHRACGGNPFLLGKVMVMIKKHKEEQNGITTQIPSGADTSAETATEKVDSEESTGVSDNRESVGETESKSKENKKKQLRKRVPRKARVSDNESSESETGFSGYGCLWYLSQRCCCLRFFWKSS